MVIITLGAILPCLILDKQHCKKCNSSNNSAKKDCKFCGNYETGGNMSILNFLLATWKVHDINPHDYLKFIIAKFPYMWKCSNYYHPRGKKITSQNNEGCNSHKCYNLFLYVWAI